VFMDAGSGINLIYAKTLWAMCISLEFLKPTDCSFHGIVPRSASYPLGRITLDVCFGNRQNYMRKARLQSHGLALSVSRDPRTTHVFMIHGSTSLHLLGTQDARTKRNHHSRGELRTLRLMRQGITQDGAKLWHDSQLWTTQR
jgi:hypothetical protein